MSVSLNTFRVHLRIDTNLANRELMTATHDAETENDSVMVADLSFIQGLDVHDVSMTGHPTFWKPVIVLGRRYHKTAPRKYVVYQRHSRRDPSSSDRSLVRVTPASIRHERLDGCDSGRKERWSSRPRKEGRTRYTGSTTRVMRASKDLRLVKRWWSRLMRRSGEIWVGRR